MTTKLVQGEGHLQAIRNSQFTDVGVNTRNGYTVYKREGAADETRIADKIQHLIGKRVVRAPKHDGQITEQMLIDAIDAA